MTNYMYNIRRSGNIEIETRFPRRKKNVFKLGHLFAHLSYTCTMTAGEKIARNVEKDGKKKKLIRN